MSIGSRVLAIALALAGALGSTSRAEGTDAAAGSPIPSAHALDDGRGTDFVVERSDNICGLDDPRQLTRPARVEHAVLLEATPEIEQMQREGVHPESARGIHLRTEAAKRVSRACEKVRAVRQFCSVWKHIRRRDGKLVPDITELVKRELGG